MSERPATIPMTPRTKLGRKPTRGVFDRDAVYRILDEGFLCHVAFVVDGQPYAIPTAYARVGDDVYVHGSSASRMLRTLAEGVDLCLTVTLLDGLVLARSAFNHSMNYRSVVILGRATLVSDAAEKLAALEAITNHIVPDRWDRLRPPTDQEVKATTVLVLPIVEASAKMRTGPPLDPEDAAWPVWAGVVPVGEHYGTPQPAPELPVDAPALDLAALARRGGRA